MSDLITRTTAWHRPEFDGEQPAENWEAARGRYGLDWDVVESPVYDVALGSDAELKPVEIAGWKQLQRSDTGHLFHIVKSSYETITLDDMGGVIAALMGGEDYHIDNVITVAKGAVVVGLLEYKDPIQLSGDPSEIRRYVMVVNSFDQRSSLIAAATNTRVWCANQISAVELGAKSSNVLHKFKHTRGWRKNFDRVLEEAMWTRHRASNATDDFVAEAERLLAMPLDKPGREAALEELFPIKAEATTRAANAARARRDDVRTILASPTCEGIAGTAWGFFQATVELADHERKTSSVDSAIARSLLRPESLKVTGAKLAVKHSGPVRPSSRPVVMS